MATRRSFRLGLRSLQINIQDLKGSARTAKQKRALGHMLARQLQFLCISIADGNEELKREGESVRLLARAADIALQPRKTPKTALEYLVRAIRELDLSG